MERRRPLLIVAGMLMVFLLAAACQAAPTPTPEPTQTPSPAPTRVPPTATPTPTATPEPQMVLASDGALVPEESNEPLPPLAPGVNPLTGLPVDADTLRHRPILVRYGNDTAARPPYGLAAADVIFEELAEGGFVTRITGAYLTTLPDTVGPIRSARPAVIDMLQQLDASLVYGGASNGTQGLLNRQPYPLYSHVGNGANLFYRMAGRPSPHNLFIHLPDLRQRMVTDQQDYPVKLGGWAFSPTAPAGTPVTHIHIPYPGEAPVDYTYSAASGAYLRNVQGAPHMDGLYRKQLAPANVVVLYLEHKNSNIVEDSLGNVAILVNWFGTGRAQVFRDGFMIDATWQRNAAHQLTRLKDANGNDIPLKPGRTWIEIVPTNYEVTVK